MNPKLIILGLFIIYAPLSLAKKDNSNPNESKTDTCLINKEHQEVCLNSNPDIISDKPTNQTENQDTNKLTTSTSPQVAESKIALIIGNKDYKDSPLVNPVNDARDMKATLENLGFKVIYRENADRENFDGAVHQFVSNLHTNSVGLFYYSGHGVQVDGSNYLVPVNVSINSSAELKSRAYDAGIILDEMKGVGNKLNIVILDACRDNPFKGFRSATGGLATMNGPKGSFIAFSTSPGSIALDGKEKNGTYTKYLIQYLHQPGLKIEELFKLVRKSVSQETKNIQIPWENSSLMGDFCFSGCKSEDNNLVETASISNTLDIQPQHNGENNHQKGIINIEMVKIPNSGFSIGKYEITQGQWNEIMTNNPSKFSSCGNECPVEMVNWEDTQKFISQLNALTKKQYRLPTETEWLLACQSGRGIFSAHNYCGSDDGDLVSWNSENSGGKTHPVGQKKPNTWGIYDMSGNVWEWTSSCFENDCSLHVYRGGGWPVNFHAEVVSAYRSWNDPANRLSSSIGFRLVLDE